MSATAPSSEESTNHLDDETLSRLEERLLEERRRYRDDLETALETAPEAPGSASGELSDVPSHPADAATHTDDMDRAQRAAERSTEAVQRIDDALRRLRDDPERYGHCRVCDEPIAVKRLELVPWTRRCSEHADAPTV